MSHLNAQTLRDLLLERDTDLVDGPFVERRVVSWPPEPVRTVLGHVMRAYLRLEDWSREGELRRARQALPD